eukprot:2447579-Pyramimonas_sp.AAC.1
MADLYDHPSGDEEGVWGGACNFCQRDTTGHLSISRSISLSISLFVTPRDTPGHLSISRSVSRSISFSISLNGAP